MPADVLERVRSEIEDRLAVLSGAVSETRQLEIALVALREGPVASRPAADAGKGHRRRKAPRRLHGRKGRRRKRAHAGANDEIVVGSLQGQAEPLDIKAVAGKTGTAQMPPGDAEAWFAGYAPADNPQIVVVALVEHGGHGSSIAAPVVRDVMAAFFHTNSAGASAVKATE